MYEDLLQRIDKVSRSVRSGNLQCSIGEQNLIIWREDERYNDLYAAVESMVSSWTIWNYLNLYVEYTRPKEGINKMPEYRVVNPDVLRGFRVTAQQILDEIGQGDYERATMHAQQIKDALAAMLPMTNVLINAREHRIDHSTLSFEEIVELSGVKPRPQPTIQFFRAAGEKERGTLLPGQFIAVKDGTEIDCVFTGYA